MIVQTRFRFEPDGWDFIRSYSDLGVFIRQDGTGELYVEAVDPVKAGRTYTETDIPIEEKSEEEQDGTA